MSESAFALQTAQYERNGSRVLNLLTSFVEVNQSFYDNMYVFSPMILISKIFKIGSSSIDLQFKLCLKEGKQVIVSEISRCVYVDSSTWKSAQLPNDFVSKFRRKAQETKTIPRFKLLTFPEKTFAHEITVRFSDIDAFQHVSHSHTLLFIEECAAAAVEQGYYQFFKDDIAFYHVKKAHSIHIAR